MGKRAITRAAWSAGLIVWGASTASGEVVAARPPRREREAVWGRVEWAIPNADGIPAWDELDLPMLALRNNSNDRGIDKKPFVDEEPQYWSGGRITDGRRWLPDFVDTPDRFELTVHGRGRVPYAGGGFSDVTPRRTRRSRPEPGARLRWTQTALGDGDVIRTGGTRVDALRLVTVDGLEITMQPSRVTIR